MKGRIEGQAGGDGSMHDPHAHRCPNNASACQPKAHAPLRSRLSPLMS